MLPEIIIPVGGIRVPSSAMRWRATRSSGPGGQNVNKVATKVELRVSLGDIEGLSEAASERLRQLAARFITTGDELLITSALTRDQARNLADAHGKLIALLERAARRPTRRRPTRPTAGSRERRLSAKRRVSEKKRGRNARGDE
ncbi:MAG: alternative ribosome rescue aminoacyl-tRNA hydrolase ArfB [Nannocystaceae bacterium]